MKEGRFPYYLMCQSFVRSPSLKCVFEADVRLYEQREKAIFFYVNLNVEVTCKGKNLEVSNRSVTVQVLCIFWNYGYEVQASGKKFQIGRAHV